MFQIESLAEAVREKDRQLEETIDRMEALQQDSSTTDSALCIMEEALTAKVSLRIRISCFFLPHYVPGKQDYRKSHFTTNVHNFSVVEL